MSGGDGSLMINKKKKIGILTQVAIFFVISILASGFITLYSQHVVSDVLVKSQTENLADRVADEVRLAIMEYPAHDWLLRYWYEYYDELEIEYDTDYEQSTTCFLNTQGRRKSKLFRRRIKSSMPKSPIHG